MILNKSALIFLMMLSGISAFGQSGAATWQSSSIKNLRNSEQRSYSCSFNIYPEDRIDWAQDGGQLITTYQINSTEGVLPEQGAGSVIYHINKEGNSGTITLERNEFDEVTLTLDQSTLSSVSAYYLFIVTRQD